MDQAAPPPTTFDPRRDMHYALSEEDQYRLEQVRAGLAAASDLFEGLAFQDAVEVDERQIAALLRVFSYSVKSVLRTAPFSGPSRH